MYKAIIFDLDNTLMSFERSVVTALHHVRTSHSLYTDEADWKAFQHRYAEHSMKRWIDHVNGSGLGSIKEVMEVTFEDALTAEHKQNHREVGHAYWGHFCSSKEFEEGAEVLLSGLYGRVKLGMISNGVGEAQRGRLQSGGVLHMFESLVISDEVGVRKPDRTIFELSLKELAMSPEEVLYVGDSITDDYVGSVNAGIDFCYYNPGQKAIHNDVVPAYTINRLVDLLDVATRSR